MPACVVFRGYSYRPAGHARTGSTDFRRCVDSHHEFLLTPLRRLHGTCDVILVTYDIAQLQVTERERHRTDLLRGYDPDLARWFPEGGSQRDTAVRALDLGVRAHLVRHYDLVVVSRFDLKYKMSPWDYGTFRPDAINFLWREWNQRAWDDHRRVPDCVHLLPGSLLPALRAGVAESDGDGRCLHTIWHKVARHTDRLHVQNPEGFVDSNTDVTDNPVYEIVRGP